jgi:hypothetical protein
MQLQDGVGHLKIVSRPALLAAPKTFLSDIRAIAAAKGLQRAIALRDSKPIFEALISALQYQGVSDAAADTFTRKNGNV